MNERIRELSAIAKHLSTDEAIHLSRVHNRTLSLDEEQEIFTEKFAELIVRECIKVVDDSTPVYSPANLQEDYCQGKLDGYHAVLGEIKQHFGVEE